MPGRLGRPLEQLVRDPLDGDALLLLGDHARRGVDRERSISYYERAGNLEAFEADAKVREAQVHVENGDYDQALRLLERAQALSSRDSVQDYMERVERVSRNR